MISRNPSITAIKFRIELFGKISLRDFVAIVFLCFAVCSECSCASSPQQYGIVHIYFMSSVFQTRLATQNENETIGRRRTYLPTYIQLRRETWRIIFSVAFETLNWQPSRSFACWNVFKILSVVFFLLVKNDFSKCFSLTSFNQFPLILNYSNYLTTRESQGNPQKITREK